MSATFEGTAESLADELGAALDGAGAPRPEVALVLGSGLGALADTLENAHAVPFTGLPSMPASTIPGHAGRFVAGLIGGVPVICQQGRVHLYEGWSAEVVTRAVRALPAIGAQALILTNAAGGLVPDWPAPCLMRIDDHDVVGLVCIVLLVGHRTCVRPPLGESVALPSLGQCLVSAHYNGRVSRLK